MDNGAESYRRRPFPSYCLSIPHTDAKREASAHGFMVVASLGAQILWRLDEQVRPHRLPLSSLCTRHDARRAIVAGSRSDPALW